MDLGNINYCPTKGSVSSEIAHRTGRHLLASVLRAFQLRVSGWEVASDLVPL